MGIDLRGDDRQCLFFFRCAIYHLDFASLKFGADVSHETGCKFTTPKAWSLATRQQMRQKRAAFLSCKHQRFK